MGTWDSGILDNDSSMDGLGSLQHEIASDIEDFGSRKPTTTSTAKLAAAVGVLLQLSPYDFDLDNEQGVAIVNAVKNHAAEIAKLPSSARKILDAVAAGGGKALAERPGTLNKAAIKLLHANGAHSPFGKREPALFAGKIAAAYVQEVAKRCITMLDEDFAEEENWSDLCREASGMGALPVLLVLEPCTVPAAKLTRWRKAAKKGLEQLVEREDEELDFQRQYYASLDAFFAIVEKHFASTKS